MGRNYTNPRPKIQHIDTEVWWYGWNNYTLLFMIGVIPDICTKRVDEHKMELIAPWNACYLPSVWWYCFIYNSSCFLTSAINVVIESIFPRSLHWRRNGHDSVSNHQLHDCLLSRLFGRRSKKTSKLRVTGLCAGNSPETGEFPAQLASNAENVSILMTSSCTYSFSIVSSCFDFFTVYFS